MNWTIWWTSMLILKMRWLSATCINLGFFLLSVHIHYITIRTPIHSSPNNCTKESRKSLSLCSPLSLPVECPEVEKMLKRTMNTIFNIWSLYHHPNIRAPDHEAIHFEILRETFLFINPFYLVCLQNAQVYRRLFKKRGRG